MEIIPETVVIGISKYGKGIFTTKKLSKNTRLLKITGELLTFAETLMLGEEECYSLQIGINKYIIPHCVFKFSNHSCDPNCGITSSFELITLRDIENGEELCWDYSTSMLERHWTMKCECGAPGCRGIVKDFDLLPLLLQEKYLNLGVVLPFIVKKLFGSERLTHK